MTASATEGAHGAVNRRDGVGARQAHYRTRAWPCNIKTYNALQYVGDSTVLIIHHDAVAYGSGTGVSTGASSAGSKSTRRLDGMSYLFRNIREQDAPSNYLLKNIRELDVPCLHRRARNSSRTKSGVSGARRTTRRRRRGSGRKRRRRRTSRNLRRNGPRCS